MNIQPYPHILLIVKKTLNIIPLKISTLFRRHNVMFIDKVQAFIYLAAAENFHARCSIKVYGACFC